MPRGLGVDPAQQAEARRLQQEQGMSVRQIAAAMGVGRSTAHELVNDAAREAGRARARARAGRRAAGPVVVGDCIEQLRAMEAGSVDAVVTDPPYGIGFMGHEWDQPGIEGRRNGTPAPYASGRPVRDGGVQGSGGSLRAGAYDLSPTANRRFQAWCEAWGAEVLRVLKPGGHAVVFGSPRTYHRLAVGLEDAGFEIRDSLMWLFGSGFPKSRNLDGGWSGWGTALKPGYEPIVLARKPLSGTVAATVLEHGTGALNIDGCRIACDENPSAQRRGYGVSPGGAIMEDRTSAETYAAARPGEALGRWPANVLLNEDAAVLLDEQSGARPSGAYRAGGAATYGDYGPSETDAIEASTGGASRFFYTAKASTRERNAGLDGLPTDDARPTMTPTSTLHRGRRDGRLVDDRVPERTPRANVHPTVKPIEVMRWLIRLVTPPGGTVLDPFLGSGTTAIAAHLEGHPVIGIERDADYAALATARLAWWSQWTAGTPTSAVLAAWAGEDPARRERSAERLAATARETGQASLFDEAAA